MLAILSPPQCGNFLMKEINKSSRPHYSEEVKYMYRSYQEIGGTYMDIRWNVAKHDNFPLHYTSLLMSSVKIQFYLLSAYI